MQLPRSARCPAARALVAHTDLPASEIVRNALGIAGGIDIYTNGHLTVEELPSEPGP